MLHARTPTDTDTHTQWHTHTSLRSSTQIQQLINDKYSVLDLSCSLPPPVLSLPDPPPPHVLLSTFNSYCPLISDCVSLRMHAHTHTHTEWHTHTSLRSSTQIQQLINNKYSVWDVSCSLPSPNPPPPPPPQNSCASIDIQQPLSAKQPLCVIAPFEGFVWNPAAFHSAAKL